MKIRSANHFIIAALPTVSSSISDGFHLSHIQIIAAGDHEGESPRPNDLIMIINGSERFQIAIIFN